MSKGNVWKHFQGEAANYDGLIVKLIPGYQEQHEVILNLIPFDESADIKVLDLGAGTGALSHLVLESFEKATVVAFDMAEKMLETCASKLERHRNRLTLTLGDFSTDDFGSGYDLILSGLSIHHLDDIEKQLLFRQLFKALRQRGAFINRDVVKGATDNLTREYGDLWRAFMRESGEDDAKWYARHLEEDNPATVEDQLRWLSETGFSDVDCYWRYFNFAIFGGRKS